MKLQSYSMIFVLALVGCGKKTADQAAQSNGHWEVTGPLSGVVDELSREKRAGKCDSAELDMKMEIVTAVDKKLEELSKNPESNKWDESQKAIKFHGGALLSMEMEKLKKSGYQTYDNSWKELYTYFKKNAANPPKEYWAIVNNYARSLVSDDAKRIGGVNMGIDENTAPVIIDILTDTQKCAKDLSCVSPNYSKAELDAIAKVPYYTSYLADIHNSAQIGERRDLITGFVDRLQYDQDRYGFGLNDSIKTRKNNDKIEIELPLIVKGFSTEDRKTLTDLIARWTDKNHSTLFRFVDGQDSTAAKFYTLFFDNIPGKRDFTNTENREIHMIQYGDTRAFAHEIGHSMGFPDHYYEMWSPEQCTYTYRHNGDDIMSDHATGYVTDDEWKLLDKSYPVK
ncbi:MAG: hypothetical protein JST80_01100 [Bdellovibrionales bacterium]|nr:hypothetical protein [Bdellovibrionales bacterium]